VNSPIPLPDTLRPPPDPGPIPLSEKGSSETDILDARRAAAQKELDVEMDLPEFARIETDRAMLGLILANLLSNAVEYTPQRGWIHIHLQDIGNAFDLRVNNSVDNLAPGDLPHLFERFWRKDTARSSSEHSGIGLSVSQAYASVLGLTLEATMCESGRLTMRLGGLKLAAVRSRAVIAPPSVAGC
jgi:signal transduction histidine kinase